MGQTNEKKTFLKKVEICFVLWIFLAKKALKLDDSIF
jgi:hypothetical protein